MNQARDASHSRNPVLSVLMPVYNEARTLRTIVSRVVSALGYLDIELICVDDASTDRSWTVLQELAADDARIMIVRHDTNRGKGAAIRTAVGHISGDIAIVQDADLEYDPADIPRVIAPILEGKADAVYGSRFAASEQRRVLLFWHSVGNRLLTLLSNMANDLNLTDMETCYKAVRADILKRLRLTSDRFGIEPEITARLAQWGARIYEVPISYHGRSYAEGKHIGWRDGLQALWLVFKFRFLDTRFTAAAEQETRQSLGRARRFRRWVLDQYRPCIGRRVLEIHPGPGHMTQLLLGADRFVALESESQYRDTLQRRFGHLENVEVMAGDLTDTAVQETLRVEAIDTVVCFDDLQRVEDPKGLVEAAKEVLVPGGHLLVHVPADPELFGSTDHALGHVRRFAADDLRQLLEAGGLEVVEVREFNRLGRLGWSLHRMLGRQRVTMAEASLFSLLIPLARTVEAFGLARGLSLIGIARRV